MTKFNEGDKVIIGIGNEMGREAIVAASHTDGETERVEVTWGSVLDYGPPQRRVYDAENIRKAE